MLCPVCDGEPAGGDHCAVCGGSLLLHARYSLEKLLGAGGQSRVYAARDNRDGFLVAIKILSLARVRDFKNVELFRRSASVLAGLSHPSIPKLLEYFEETRPGFALYALVHELIDGETLAESQRRGERFDEGKVRLLAKELLGALGYLHGLSPPVIHRDLKPSNLMRRRDGSLVIIDFDLVRDVLRPDGGSTMSAGTPGYTPIEQYAGEATPATDLYAMGVTLLVLLSRQTPLELRRSGEQHLDVRGHTRVSDQLTKVLEKLVEPEPLDRYQSAKDVLAALDAPRLKVVGPVAERPPLVLPPAARGSGTIFVVGTLLASAIAATIMFTRGSPRRVPPPVLVTTATPSPPKPPKPTVTLAKLSPAEAATALTASVWDGKLDNNRLRLTVTTKHGKLQGQLTTFGSFAGPQDRGSSEPVRVEVTGIGSIILRRPDITVDSVALQQTFFGDLTSDLGAITGSWEIRYAAAGSGYVVNRPWTAVKGAK